MICIFGSTKKVKNVNQKCFSVLFWQVDESTNFCSSSSQTTFLDRNIVQVFVFCFCRVKIVSRITEYMLQPLVYRTHQVLDHIPIYDIKFNLNNNHPSTITAFGHFDKETFGQDNICTSKHMGET